MQIDIFRGPRTPEPQCMEFGARARRPGRPPRVPVGPGGLCAEDRVFSRIVRPARPWGFGPAGLSDPRPGWGWGWGRTLDEYAAISTIEKTLVSGESGGLPSRGCAPHSELRPN